MGFWQGRSVLVTGAGGFIGSHLTEALVCEGAHVRALVRYNSEGRRGFIDDFDPAVQASIEVISGTVEDPFAIRQAVQGCDTVFHLAALIGIPYSYVAPQHYVATNVLGTVNVLEACRSEGVRRLVQTSTSETYGTAQYAPIDELHPAVGQSPYAATKVASDQMALSYHKSFELPVTVLRPFNTYGPRQSMRAVVPSIMTQLLAGGDSIRVGSVDPKRDLNFVSDTVAGFLGIAQCDAAIGEAVNVGSGRTWSIGEVLGKIMVLAGREVSIVQDAQRVRPDASEVRLLLADIQKAERLFAYAPVVDLDTGLEATWNWLQANLHRFRPDRYAI